MTRARVIETRNNRGIGGNGHVHRPYARKLVVYAPLCFSYEPESTGYAREHVAYAPEQTPYARTAISRAKRASFNRNPPL